MNKAPLQNNFKYWAIALLIPTVAWAILYKIWIGRFFFAGDNTDYFYWFIYYFKNMLHGVYPLWNPFKTFGCLDYIDTQYIGVYNPLSMIIPVLLFCGLKACWAYTSYVVIFWMMGFLGVFFLLKRLYNDPRLAWVGTSLLMFSAGLAVSFAGEILVLYIFAPLGWFFGFLVGFVKSSDDAALKRNMLGLALSIMFLANLYVPCYFLTLFFTFLVSVLLFAGQWIIQFLAAVKKSLKRMPWATVFCLVSILFSFWPTVDCYLKMKDPQNITDFMRGENADKTGHDMDVSQQMIDIGGLPSRSLFTELFSSYETGDQYYSFVPLILYILALLTLFNRSSRPQRVIFMTGFLLLLITITNAAPLQHLLYKYLHFFRLFRNYFFFWVLFWSCCVVYVMGEIKQFLNNEIVSPRQKILYASWVILVHAGAMGYLMFLEDVPLVSYVTVVASCCLFLTRLFAAVRGRPTLFVIAVVFIGLWQPFYVLPFIRGVDHGTLDYKSKPQAFSYVRPLYGSGYNEKNALSSREKYFQDESGFVENGYMGQKGTYLLQQHLSKEILSDYVRYKFIIYDQVNSIPENNIDWGKVGQVVTFKDNAALIWDESNIALSNGHQPPSAPIIVKGPDANFKILHFDVNTVELSIHLNQRKFLVYNDSFHTGWHVLVDGMPAKLYQANIAFKGVWIEKGRHVVKFYFGSWLDYLRGWGVSLLFIFLSFLVIIEFLPYF